MTMGQVRKVISLFVQMSVNMLILALPALFFVCRFSVLHLLEKPEKSLLRRKLNCLMTSLVATPVIEYLHYRFNILFLYL